ncbi:15077_t:CDS:2, partial [Funneliformis geosporum]
IPYDQSLKNKILGGERERKITNTPHEYCELYTSCWNPSPEKRPDIELVYSELSNIIHKISENQRDSEWIKNAIINEHINYYEYNLFNDMKEIGSGGFDHDNLSWRIVQELRETAIEGTPEDYTKIYRDNLQNDDCEINELLFIENENNLKSLNLINTEELNRSVQNHDTCIIANMNYNTSSLEDPMQKPSTEP